MSDPVTSGDLPAGRELDALIAEKVMHLFSEELGHNCDHHNYGPQMHCEACDRDTVNCQIPPYSTSIAAAWEVVEKVLYPRGWYLVPMPKTDGKDWGVFEGDDLFEVAIGDSAPHAICLAALKAVEAPKEP